VKKPEQRPVLKKDERLGVCDSKLASSEDSKGETQIVSMAYNLFPL
jgi:hypothetical protein